MVRWASRRRFPVLLGITAALLVLNLLVPDPVPFLDELVLALGAALLASWRRPEPSGDPPEDRPSRTDGAR